MIKLCNISKSQVTLQLNTAKSGNVNKTIPSNTCDYVEEVITNLADIKKKYKKMIEVSVVVTKDDDKPKAVKVPVQPKKEETVLEPDFKVHMETKKAGRGVSRHLVITDAVNVDESAVQYSSNTDKVQVSNYGKVSVEGTVDNDVVITATIGDLVKTITLKASELK